MSIPVSLDELREVASQQAPFAYLLTVTNDASAHVVAVMVSIDEGIVACVAGKGSCANASARPNVSLLWPPATTDDYSLIVDGQAAVDGSTVRVVPSRAVRHRPAPGGGNDCAPVALD